MKKQWLSIVLVLCMVLCLAPATARAAEGETGTLKITVKVLGLDEGDDAGGKTFSFKILRKYAIYGLYKNVDITIDPGKTEGTMDVPVEAGKYIVEQIGRATIDGYDPGSVTYTQGEMEVFANKSKEITVNNHYEKAVAKEITELPITVTGYALNAKVSGINASTEQMRVAINNNFTVKQLNASGVWEPLESDATIQADTQYAVEILVNAKTGYTYTGLTGDNVTVNGKKASEFEKNPSTQPGGDMRVFHELEVLKVVKKVDHIEITTPPTKTEYKAGEDFDPTGMVVTAHYTDGTTADLSRDKYVIFYGDKLALGRASVTIQYNDGSGNSGIYVDLPITVKPYEGNHKHTYDNSWYSDAKSHWHWCSDKECPDPSNSTKDLAPHTFEWKVDKEATTTQTGLKHEECNVCHFKRSKNTVIPVLPGSGTTEPGTTIPGTTGGTTGAAKSPKTGDAGIALYAGLSLLMLSGGGWVAGKKRREEKK
jgi:LPXTG-motif cell wall-anchored protein